MARAVCAAASSVARSTSAASASSSTSSQSKGWLVYVVETKGGKLYTGITVSLRRRMEQHAGTRDGGRQGVPFGPAREVAVRGDRGESRGGDAA